MDRDPAPAPHRLSVVIPTLREAATIAGAVRSALDAGASEVIVADGGSDDGTAARALAAGALVTTAPRGRGPQLNAGAALATGDVLCFVHADVRLPPDAAAQIARALRDPQILGGNFRVRFGRGGHGRFLAALYHVIRQLRIFYGDSAIWVRRDAFHRAGRFPPHPLMEDLAFVHRLMSQGRLAYLDGPVEASPRRWVEGGLARTWASWLVIQTLYFYRVPPATLARLYRHIR
jgi:rSAM/selenodomain-associated transferase 2